MAAAGGGRRREAAEAAKGRDLGVDLGGPGEDDLPERGRQLPKLFNFFSLVLLLFLLTPFSFLSDVTKRKKWPQSGRKKGKNMDIKDQNSHIKALFQKVWTSGFLFILFQNFQILHLKSILTIWFFSVYTCPGKIFIFAFIPLKLVFLVFPLFSLSSSCSGRLPSPLRPPASSFRREEPRLAHTCLKIFTAAVLPVCPYRLGLV